MAVSFNQPPINDPFVNKNNGKLTGISSSWLSTFFETLVQYLSETGIFLPVLTTAQRDDIQTPKNGQMIYNSTAAAPQIYQGGVWRTFTTTP